MNSLNLWFRYALRCRFELLNHLLIQMCFIALFPILHDLFHPPHLPIRQADLDPMWMIRGFGENILDDAFGQFAGTLILFQYNEHRHTRFDGCASLAIHGIYVLKLF